VFVDWSNVRLSLACGRRRAGPGWVLRALIEAVRRLAPEGAEVTVELYFPPAAELRADRALLEDGARKSGIVLRQHADHSDLTEVALALGVSGAWYGGAATDLAVASDQRALAYVVAELERAPRQGRSIRLLHLHDRPPLLGRDLVRPRSPRHLRLALDQPAERRGWTDWDMAAWALRRLAAYTPEAIAERNLRPPAGQAPRDLWRRSDVAHTGWEWLDRVDGLVADLWRLDWGQPVSPEHALAEIARRLGAGTTTAQAVLDALLVAQLVRWHDSDHLEVPSSWREGLLLPARRAVLGLARQPNLTHPLYRLERRHRQRFLKPPVFVPEVEQASRTDSWRWVKHALRDQLRVVVERTERRSSYPSSRANWRLASTRFSLDTIAAADQLCSALETPRTVAELELRAAVPGGWRLGRWLRCLRDVGLVEPRPGGRWARDLRAALHTPEYGD
jgi:hypothetical protein